MMFKSGHQLTFRVFTIWVSTKSTEPNVLMARCSVEWYMVLGAELKTLDCNSWAKSLTAKLELSMFVHSGLKPLHCICVLPNSSYAPGVWGVNRLYCSCTHSVHVVKLVTMCQIDFLPFEFQLKVLNQIN